MKFEKVVIPPKVLRKIQKKHSIEDYEVYQALESAKNKEKSRKRWMIVSRTMAGRCLRIYFEEFKGTVTVVSAREDR